MRTWEELRARIAAGESVPLDYLAGLLAAAPLPDDLLEARITIARAPKRRGRPRYWSDEDLRIIRNICARVKFWSEVNDTPLTKGEILDRVGGVLRSPMEGKALATLFRRYPAPPRRGIQLVTGDDIRSVLHDRLVESRLGIPPAQPVFPSFRLTIRPEL